MRTSTVDLITCALLLGLAALLGWDSWRTGAAWAPDGPEAGYFPFYLALLLGAASLFGMARAILSHDVITEAFLTRDQIGRVAAVFLPTLAFVLLTQVLGIYVASFLLVAGFMTVVGRIRWWISLFTAVVFSGLMFAVFEIAFNVIMPKGPLEAAFGY
nr:tripartite tricarboxylate transporter TctB family protein [Rhodoplanes roseus]